MMQTYVCLLKFPLCYKSVLFYFEHSVIIVEQILFLCLHCECHWLRKTLESVIIMHRFQLLVLF